MDLGSLRQNNFGANYNFLTKEGLCCELKMRRAVAIWKEYEIKKKQKASTSVLNKTLQQFESFSVLINHYQRQSSYFEVRIIVLSI